MHAPASRVRALNASAVSARGEYVLYWMVSARRGRFNFALEQAVGHARARKLPLFVFEPLRVSYPWASVRLHTFVVQGMAANAAHFAKTSAYYFPYLEPQRGASAGLLAALAARAALVVTDDYPCFFMPRMTAAAARSLDVRVEAVDGNGLLPLSLADGKSFYNAYHFRRFVQRHVAYQLNRGTARGPAAPAGAAAARELAQGAPGALATRE